MLGPVQISKFVKDKSGATIIYVTMIMAVLIGMAGMAVDFSRLHIAHTQAQSAADAASIAAANQLDGSAGAMDRAIAAAEAAMLVANNQDFADEENADAHVSVTINFLNTLPDSDDTAIDPNDYLDETDSDNDALAEFAVATTEILTHRNVLLPVLNIAGRAPLRATAVAGQESSICRVTPFAICNPNEDPVNGGSTAFDYTTWIGRQILVKQAPSAGADWAPGNFGFLLPQAVTDDFYDEDDMGMNISMGAGVIADMLASVNGANQCFSSGLDTRVGQINGIRNALNTRFDMYETPGFGMASDKIDYPPARNVTKGYRRQEIGSSGTYDPCDVENVLEESPAQTPTLMGFPKDNFTNATALDGTRFGDGQWDCPLYWSTNHPDTTPAMPLTCVANGTGMTRYEMYRWEIANNEIPGTDTGGPEEGVPGCSSEVYPFDEDTDRRLVHFAVMNCVAENVHGSATNVPSVAFIRAFMTEPVNGVDFDVYLEVVDAFDPGSQDGPLKEYVEIYR
jgi:Flp pilus assembly protein TadG